MADVKLQQVTKIYDNGVVGVSELDLEIPDGSFFVLVGPSGCGKTTILRMVAGLETVTAGDILIGGVRVNDRSPAKRDIAMVFQNYALYPHMTVRANIELALKIRKVPRVERRRKIDDVAQMLGLEELLGRKPAKLSGGQRQRVAMARAIVRDPSVFLLDEPLSNLDAQLRAQVRADMAELQHRLGTTTIFVTHDQTEAMTLADRVAVMNGGELQQLGSPAELYDEPANLFVARFLGSPEMNLLNGRLEGRDGVVVFAASDLGHALDVVLPDQLGLASELTDGGRDVVLGIRPEHVRIGRPEPSEPCVVGRTRLSESLGHERIVHVTLNGREDGAVALDRRGADRFIVRQAATQVPQVDDEVSIVFQPSHVHLFDAVSGARLAPLVKGTAR
jgi:ABC-type sugar transport system ATPase subunit